MKEKIRKKALHILNEVAFLLFIPLMCIIMYLAFIVGVIYMIGERYNERKGV